MKNTKHLWDWVLSFDCDGKEVFRSVVTNYTEYFKPLDGVAYIVKVSLKNLDL